MRAGLVFTEMADSAYPRDMTPSCKRSTWGSWRM